MSAENTKKLTNKEVTAACKELGITARKVDGEWQVRRKGAAAITTYFTNDAQDALDTARLIAASNR